MALRNFYNISNDSEIYMIKIEIIQEGMRIPKIEYKLFSKINEIKKKLNLNACQNIKINIFYPFELNESIATLDSKSGYYNDVCYTAKSQSGTDISLEDRKNEYPNKAVCQDECDFADYNYAIKKANCSCKVKESSKSFALMKIDKQKLLANFKDIKNIANINMLACTKKLFSKLGITTNIGFFIIIFIVLFRIIALFIFYIKQ